MENSIFFNAHHSPIGAFASFTLGHKGASGGLGLELAGPANQNIYIGLQKKDSGGFECLPFYGAALNDKERFDNTTAEKVESGNHIVAFQDSSIKRVLEPGSDVWSAGDLTFSIYSPVVAIPDPDTHPEGVLKQAIIPAVFIEITVDNTGFAKERTAFFGFQGTDPYSSMRHISGNPNVGLTGIGQGRIYAICTDDKNVKSGTAFSIEDLVFAKNESGLSFGLGTVAALIMKAAAGEKKTWRFVVCFYRDGIVTAGMNATYYYTKFFSSIEDVASYGLVHFDIYKENALESNNIAGFCSLSDDRKFMLAHAIRSYYGSTELLLAENKPLWIVNEGEYRMINTFDLAVDHLFYEVKKNPWTVKNVLDTYTRFYSYYDTISLPDSKTCSAGIGFTHDMGVANTFSPHHHSVYELPGLQGCFSYMTHEQLVNWILCAGVYCATTCDTVWLHSNRAVIEACFESMLNRDHPDPLKRDGIMDFDSSRAGKGSEITTYDNVDSSLGQARRNAYLAVKCWAAYLSLSFLFRSLENGKSAEDAIMQADLCADTICSFRRSDGTIPALLQDDNNSMLIPIIEGLVFPYFFNKEMVDNAGRYGELIDLLTAHCRAVLKKGVCIFDDGGWRLSSTSKNSWLSKIYLCQFVTEKILGIDADSEADRTHVQWLLNENNSYYAWSDQMLEGIVCGSRYYPRGVTSVLWLK